VERGVLTEQRTNIKYLVKLGKSKWEILEMLETVYGESAMKRRTVKSGSMAVCLAAKKRVRVIKKSNHALWFFYIYIRGVVYREFVPQGQTVNATFYVEVLKHLREHV
jgi:hypothetical protein